MVGPGVRPTRLPLSDDRLKGMGANAGPPEPHPWDNAPKVSGLIGGWVPRPLRNIPSAHCPRVRRRRCATSCLHCRDWICALSFTLGPFLDPAEFAAPSNVALERFVPHSAALLRHASPHTGPRDLCNKTAR